MRLGVSAGHKKPAEAGFLLAASVELINRPH
jgi:hypothetical protein